MRELSLYIHFPYCLYKCHYCDFNSYVVKDSSSLQMPYIEALLQELKVAKRNFSLQSFKTIFLGGGTPSLFEPKNIGALLKGIEAELGIAPQAEITLEANPKTLSREKIRDYLATGVNRFSMGVQSFQDRFLTPLGRLHTGKEAIQALSLLEEEAQNFSFDLMFGFPEQSLSDLKEDLSWIDRFNAKHLSFYNLTLEEGTIFAEQYRKGKLKLLESDLQAQMYETGIQLLQDKGYSLYEISNFSKPGLESRHNLNYWNYGDYLGLGAGAVSFLSRTFLGANACIPQEKDLYGFRWTNAKAPETYLQGAGKDCSQHSWEKISSAIAQKEFWMMGLRLKEGVSIEKFEKRFGPGSYKPYSGIVESLLRNNWIEHSEDRIRLHPKGQLLANEVIASFFI